MASGSRATPSPTTRKRAFQAVERFAPEDWFAKYQPPALDLLASPSTSFEPMSDEELAGLARRLQTALDDFGVSAEVVEVTQGPVVTLLELRLARGVKVSRVASLEADLALAMRSPFVRVQTIPGKAAVGVEIVNERAAPVVLRDVIGAEEFWRDASPLLFAMGKTVDGSPFVCDLERLPHLLIAGATGSGKSVALNALICSILYHVSPEMARFVLIDPKRVELNVYDDIPHLAAPIVSEPEEAAAALAWALDLMNERYRRLQTMRARNIARYNDIALGRRRPPRPGPRTVPPTCRAS
jgi:S-DNA-T family DNA segregation ATPase FtsK/SpoIIIE